MSAVAELAQPVDLSVVPEGTQLLPLVPNGLECERNPKGNPAFSVWDAQAQEYGPSAPELCVARKTVLESQGLLGCGECACAKLIEIAQTDPVQRADLAARINVTKGFTTKKETN